MQNNWMPIETAPRDGTRILIVNMVAPNPIILSGRCVNGVTNGDWHIWGDGWVSSRYPTHWMFCPSLPVTKRFLEERVKDLEEIANQYLKHAV